MDDNFSCGRYHKEIEIAGRIFSHLIIYEIDIPSGEIIIHVYFFALLGPSGVLITAKGRRHRHTRQGQVRAGMATTRTLHSGRGGKGRGGSLFDMSTA